MATGLFSAIGAVFKAMRFALTRKGVNVGGTAGYPRIEIHTITESEFLDKSQSLKRMTCIVECMSTERMADVFDMNEENLNRLLTSSLNLDADWHIVGIEPGQAQELTEASETQTVIYRLMQNVTIFVERLNG